MTRWTILALALSMLTFVGCGDDDGDGEGSGGSTWNGSGGSSGDDRGGGGEGACAEFLGCLNACEEQFPGRGEGVEECETACLEAEGLGGEGWKQFDEMNMCIVTSASVCGGQGVDCLVEACGDEMERCGVDPEDYI